jgi:hypothetical protein
MKNAYEDEVEDLANVLYGAVKEMPVEAMPFGEVPLDDDEQLERYKELRDDVDAWVTLIDEEGLGPTVEYAKEMESRLAKEPSDSDGGEDELDPILYP